MVKAQALLDTPQVYVALIIMFVIGLVLDLLLGLVQKRAARWLPA